jgi:hypothetical protein
MKRVKRIKPYTTAYLEDGTGGRIVVKIPVNLRGIVPEEPKVVLFERRAYLQTSTSPLTYVNVLGGRARRR